MKALTEAQKSFAHKVAKEKKSPTEAVKEVYEGHITTEQGLQTWTDHVMEKPQVKREIVKLLEEMRLGKKDLVLMLYKILNKPKGKDALKLKGIEMGLRLHGEFDRKVEDGKGRVNNLLAVFMKNRQERGLEVPEEVKEAVELIKDEGLGEELTDEPEVIPTNNGFINITKSGGKKVQKG